jgi:hypothetical protein
MTAVSPLSARSDSTTRLLTSGIAPFRRRLEKNAAHKLAAIIEIKLEKMGDCPADMGVACGP